MTDYVNAPEPQDPDELKAQAADYLRDAIPGWEPAEGNLDWLLIEAFAEIAAQIGETITDVARGIFRYFGANLAQLLPIEASTATGTVTLTAVDTAGHTLPAGSTFLFGDDDVAFQTVDDATIAAGSTTLAAVQVVAVEAGASGSGKTGTGTLVDPYDFIASVTLDGPTAGGEDAETDEAYLVRLVEELALMAPRPILPDDFAGFALRIPGVGRALAVNGYNPADGTFDNERYVAVFVTDAAGADVSAGVQTAVQDDLESRREANFVCPVASPTRTTIDVGYTATAWPEFDPVEVKAAADAAIENFLDPARWGQPDFGETRRWENETKVRYLELAQALNSVEGLRYVDSLTINGSAADFTMTGVVTLPSVGTITGTVS